MSPAAPAPAGAPGWWSSRPARWSTSYQFGIVFQHNTAWAGFRPFRVGITDADRARHADLYALIKQIPADASVAAAEMLVAQVSSRKNAYTFQHRPTTTPTTSCAGSRSAATRPDQPGERAADAATTGWWREKGEFVLFRRGAPAAPRLRRYLRRIGAGDGGPTSCKLVLSS